MIRAVEKDLKNGLSSRSKKRPDAGESENKRADLKNGMDSGGGKS